MRHRRGGLTLYSWVSTRVVFPVVAPQLQIDRFLSLKVEVLWVAVDSGGLLDAPGSFVAAGGPPRRRR